MHVSIITIVCVCLHFGDIDSLPQSSSFRPDENETWRQLHLAIKDGNEDDFRRLLIFGANINAIDENGNTALLLAAKRGSEIMIKMLIEDGADINAVNNDKNSALIIAAKNGFEKIVEILIGKGANINAKNKLGASALILAASKGYQQIVEILVKHGASTNISDQRAELEADQGYTAILDLIEGVPRRSQQACDMYTVALHDRIIGGTLAEVDEFPWLAALGYFDQDDQLSYKCGATIISEYFLLTAAHCTKKAQPPVRVRYGTLTLTSPNAQRRSIQEIIRHPDYSIGTKKNDIALIRVTESIQFSNSVRPACLRTDMNDVDTDAPLVVTGWGSTTADRQQMSNDLLKTSLRTMPLSECNATMVKYFPNEVVFRNGIGESQYCAYDPDGEKDSCQGDSGGPLQLIRHDTQLPKIVGIVSFGISCGTKLPSIYTRVSYYLEWIETYVWPNGVISIPNFVVLLL